MKKDKVQSEHCQDRQGDGKNKFVSNMDLKRRKNILMFSLFEQESSGNTVHFLIASGSSSLQSFQFSLFMIQTHMKTNEPWEVPLVNTYYQVLMSGTNKLMSV